MNRNAQSTDSVDSCARCSSELADRRARVKHLLEAQIWPMALCGPLAEPLTREQREALLGYGPEGV
jgi:hypothetical protein